MKKVIGIIAGIALAGLIVMLLLPGLTDQYQSENAAEAVLDNLIEQN